VASWRGEAAEATVHALVLAGQAFDAERYEACLALAESEVDAAAERGDLAAAGQAAWLSGGALAAAQAWPLAMRAALAEGDLERAHEMAGRFMAHLDEAARAALELAPWYVRAQATATGRT
jgi:hypothetical protein